MNVLEINTVNFGSTGNIMLDIADSARKKGHKVWCAYPNYKINKEKKIENTIFIGGKISDWIHTRIFRAFGLNGCGSVASTIIFLWKINKLHIHLVHLHNLHDCYINFPLLFHYLKKKNIPIIWTLHDCWPFTGQCAHYDMIGCKKWINGCNNCQQIHVYPSSGMDKSTYMWRLKKKTFNGVSHMLLIAPSIWMKEQIKQSFLKDYPIKVIYNGIDLSVFYRREQVCNLIPNIHNKYIVLGVSFAWSDKKGLDVFIELSKRLDEEKYQIVIVGTNENIDKDLPSCIISIHRTQNQSELAEIYSSADVFVNPTRQEVLGLVNIEALACGTPVVTFNTGGSPEVLDETCGCVIFRNDIDSLEKEIIRICEEKPYSKNACIRRAQRYEKSIMLEKYMEIYEEKI
ncbi:glycosyltransferase [Clostridiales bacterium FE2010]|nr:glycosyltransferase [Clostridiales bacterium FE2010]